MFALDKTGKIKLSTFVLLLLLSISCFGTKPRTVIVGVYDNPPKVEIGPDGKPRGIFIDIIEYVAKQEGWRIKYSPGLWEEKLKQLEKGEISVMPDVAYSESRSKIFDFNRIAILSSWLQLYSKKNIFINSIADLQGKTIAVLEGSIQQQVCENIRNEFGVSFNVISLPDYKSTIKSVADGKADGVIVSRFYGYRHKENNDIVKATPIILNLTSLHFATPKGQNQDILCDIDKHLSIMLNDPNSVYYQSLSNWLQEKPKMFVPKYIFWAIITISSLVLLLFFLSLILRWQVNVRTKELIEKNIALEDTMEKLKLAQKEALKNERLYAFCQLAIGIAHDFNNLLFPIVNFTEMMLKEPEELENKEIARKNLEVIHNAAKLGTEMIQRMQKFHRSSEQKLEKEKFDINPVIEDAIELTKKQWMGSSKKPPINVIFNKGSTTEIIGVKSAIHEMAVNLILNAIDAMPNGGQIEITTVNIDGSITIIFKDTGIGMSKEVREKCLQPFFTTKGEKGTGMGLTMVNNIVTEHRGDLKILSEEGRGTTFIITFPSAST